MMKTTFGKLAVYLAVGVALLALPLLLQATGSAYPACMQFA